MIHKSKATAEDKLQGRIALKDMLPFLHLVADEKWHWALNQQSKYIQIVFDIDTREGGAFCNAYDRDGFMVTLEQLKFQYAAERQPSPNPV